MLTNALDDRAERVQAELDEARRLKEEASRLLAEYQGKQRQAETEAASIIEGARAEAERIAAEARVKMEEFVARARRWPRPRSRRPRRRPSPKCAPPPPRPRCRRRKESEPVVKGKVADDLIARGISDVKAKLNSRDSSLPSSFSPRSGEKVPNARSA